MICLMSLQDSPTDDNEIGDDELKVVQKHIDALKECFDTVQIFVTRHESDNEGTLQIGKGRGNYFARYGQIEQWLLKEKETIHKDIMNDGES